MPWDTTKSSSDYEKMRAAIRKYKDEKMISKTLNKPNVPTKPMGTGSLAMGSSPAKPTKGYTGKAAPKKPPRGSNPTVGFGPGGNTVMMKAAQRKLDEENKAKSGATTRTDKTITSPSAPKSTPTRAKLKTAATKARLVDRADRKARGDYKGKYWGPDQFKGNQNKIDAWKKAGKPDISEFLKKK